MAIIPKKEEAIIEKAIDYLSIVDSLNDDVFAFCVRHLYPVLGYRVLPLEDVRRIDLKEKLLGLEEDIPTLIRKKAPSTLNHYFYTLQQYFENNFTPQAESRCGKYKNQALAILSKNLNEVTLDDIDDLFLLFVAILRTYSGPEGLQTTPIENAIPSFRISPIDVALLKDLLENVAFAPDAFTEKKGIRERKDLFSNQGCISLRMMFINNILFLGRALQNFGCSVEENA